MMYTIKFIDGSKIQITEDEYKKLANKTGLVFIPSLRETINLSSISRIYPSENEPEETDHTIGVLHDGSKVIRQFGQWFCLDGEVTEKGTYSVRPDPIYYPEVAMDCVPSVKTYELKYQALPAADRKLAICGGKDSKRFFGSGSMTSIAGVIAGKKTLELEAKEPEWCEKHGSFLVDCTCFDQREIDKLEVDRTEKELDIAN